MGIDISDACIEGAKALAKVNNIGNIDFFVMDAMHTSFEDKKFDIICGNSILHHLDLAASLAEIKRLLKDGGKAYFLEPLATNPLIQFYRIFTPKMRTADERPFKRKEIKLIQSVFPQAKIEYFNCFTLLAVPFRHSKGFDKILSFCAMLDKFFLGAKSPFKYLAWTCLLTLRV